MKCIKYQLHQMWTASQENWYWDDSINLNMINKYKLTLHRFESASKKKKKHFERKSVYNQQRIKNAITVK